MVVGGNVPVQRRPCASGPAAPRGIGEVARERAARDSRFMVVWREESPRDGAMGFVAL